MITLQIRYSGENGNARKFAQEMISSGTVAAIREETGNLRYEYFLPLEEDGSVLLVDSWENQAALDIHHHSPMMPVIMQLREKYDLHMQVERYVTDAACVPDKDQAFIRK